MKQTIAKMALVWLMLCALVVQGGVLAGAEESSARSTVTLQVATAAELEAVRSEVAKDNTVNIILTADLELDQWEGLGTGEHLFTGTFDGGGHTVTINGGESLLGAVSGATVKDVMVFGSVQDTAPLATYAANSTFTDCGNAARVTGPEGGYACGLVSGSAGVNTYTRCFNTGIVEAKNGTVCGIASDNPQSGMTPINTFENTYNYCYNAGALIGNRVYAIAEVSLPGVSATANYSAVESTETSNSVGYTKITEKALSQGTNPSNWGAAEWRYINGMYPMTYRSRVTDGDIAATAAAWTEGESLYLFSFDEGVWKTDDGKEIQSGTAVSLPQEIVFEYRGLKRTVKLDGGEEVQVVLTDAARLSTEQETFTGTYLEEKDFLLEARGLSTGSWSMVSGEKPEGLTLENDRLKGTITARPDTYEAVFMLRDPNTRQYALLEVTVTVNKAQGGITCAGTQTKTFTGEGQQPDYTLAAHAELKEIQYQDQAGTAAPTDQSPVNAGTYTVTVCTQETEYYLAAQASCTLTIRPYVLEAADFEPVEPQPWTGTAAEPTVTPRTLTDCVAPNPEDYQVSYDNNIGPTYKEGAAAKVILQPTGNYTTGDGSPIEIDFVIYVADKEVTLAAGRGYTLGTAGTSWTLNNESNKVTYTGGTLFYVRDPGTYTFTPAV